MGCKRDEKGGNIILFDSYCISRNGAGGGGGGGGGARALGPHYFWWSPPYF